MSGAKVRRGREVKGLPHACCLLALSLAGSGCIWRPGLVWVSGQVVPIQMAQERQLAAEFSRRSGISVGCREVVGREEMAKMIRRGVRADVIMVSSSEMRLLAVEGLLLPLDGVAGADVSAGREWFYLAALEAGKVGGKLYGLPVYVDVPVVFYNREIIRRLGVTQPPRGWKWEDYVAKAKALTRDLDGDGTPDVYGTCHQGELDALLAQEGVRLFSDEGGQGRLRCCVNSATVRQLLEFYLRLHGTDGVSQPAGRGADPVREFSTGKAAMLTAGASWLGEVTAATDFDVDVAPVPAATLGRGYRVLGVMLLCVPRSCRRQREALRFVKFACEWKGWGMGGGIPAARSVAESDRFLAPLLPGMKEVVAGLEHFLPPREAYEKDFLRKVWVDEVAQLVEGKQSLETTLLEMERMGNEMVGSQ